MPAPVVAHETNAASDLASQHPALVRFARIGWAAKGAVYVVAGIIAAIVAFTGPGAGSSTTGEGNSPDDEATPTGAIRSIAQTWFGPIVIIVLAAGLFLYAAWRIASALMPGDNTEAKVWGTRITYLGSGAISIGVGLSALKLLIDDGSGQDSDSRVSDATASVLGHFAGRLVVATVGLALIAVAAYRIRKGLKEDVTDGLDLTGVSAQRRVWIGRFGGAGKIGRGISIGLVGFFLIRAAITFDPNEATGLDGSLRRMADQPWGPFVVLAVAIGFASYGIYCLISFTRRRLEPI